MGKAHRTLWDRRFRSNVESDLNIFNNRSVQIISPPANIGSVSFILENKANSGRLFTKGTTTLDISEITPLPIDQKRSVVLTNGRLYLSSVDVSALVKDFTVAGDFIIGNGGGNNEDFNISHLTFYDDSRVLTQQEIYELHVNGGITSKSTHNIIREGSLPLTERYGFKSNAAFIVKHTQFIVGDNVFFDTVEQYNYARNQSVDPNFNNWTLGDASFSSTSTTMSYDGTAGGLRTSFDDVVNGSDIQFIKARFNVTSLGAGDSLWVWFGSIAPESERIEITTTGIKELFLRNGLNTPRIFFANGNGFGPADITAVWTVEDIELVPLVANHAKAVNFTDAELGTGGDVRTQSVKKAFYDKITNIWYQGGGDPLPENMLEIDSGFIPILQSLRQENGITIGETYASIVGMGFTFKLSTSITALSEIITGLPAITKFKFNGIILANEATLITEINLVQLCHIDLEWASASPTVTFVHTGEDYELIRDYYLDEVLTEKESIELTNNILFSNPIINNQLKFNYYALHNESNYVEGSTNPENVPLIDADTIGNRESIGWTGGTSALKLADLITNLTDIEQLR